MTKTPRARYPQELKQQAVAMAVVQSFRLYCALVGFKHVSRGHKDVSKSALEPNAEK